MCTLSSCSVDKISSFTCALSSCYVEQIFSCMCTLSSCYVDKISSFTCALSSCYIDKISSCTCTLSSCYIDKIFSCTCTLFHATLGLKKTVFSNLHRKLKTLVGSEVNPSLRRRCYQYVWRCNLQTCTPLVMLKELTKLVKNNDTDKF